MLEVIIMKCKQCGTEFEGNFCPECGTKFEIETPTPPPPIQQQPEQQQPEQQQAAYQQPTPAKTYKPNRQKKPFIIAMAVLLLVIIAVVGIALIIGGDSEKIVWDDIVLGDILPEPPVDKGRIHDNSTDKLWLVIIKFSDQQFNDYIDACKEKGFTVEAESDSSSYDAYNPDGYKLELSYYGNSSEIWIELEKPMEMTTITWPTGAAGNQLIAPKSTIGNFYYEYDDNFLVYVGDTSKADYAEYVAACSEKGFNVDYSKGDDYYYADNSDGWHVSICYEGNNIMSIHIYALDDDDTSDSSSVDTEPEANASAIDSQPSNDSAVSYDRTNPAPINTAQTIDYRDYIHSYNATVEVTEILRGTDAWKKIADANIFNSEPDEGYEYILAKIKVTANSVKDDAALDINHFDFTAYSSDNVEYDNKRVTVVKPDPALDGKIFAGASREGYTVFAVKETDAAPKMVFGEQYDGTGGIWFKLS